MTDEHFAILGMIGILVLVAVIFFFVGFGVGTVQIP